MVLLGLKSDLGQTRVANEDSCLARVLPYRDQKAALLAVADGIGGHRAGDVASRTAIGILEGQVVMSLVDGLTPLVALETAVQSANQAVFDLAAREERYRGMGTTLTAALLTREALYVAHVGDSRLYLYRGEACRQLTADHSLVGELVENGEISLAEAKLHPQRNILTRAIGIDNQVKIDLFSQPLQAADVILLASDGLFTLLDNAVIANHIAVEAEDLQQVAERLVAHANECGGHDNISVVLAKWGCAE